MCPARAVRHTHDTMAAACRAFWPQWACFGSVFFADPGLLLSVGHLYNCFPRYDGARPPPAFVARARVRTISGCGTGPGCSALPARPASQKDCSEPNSARFGRSSRARNLHTPRIFAPEGPALPLRAGAGFVTRGYPPCRWHLAAEASEWAVSASLSALRETRAGIGRLTAAGQWAAPAEMPVNWRLAARLGTLR